MSLKYLTYEIGRSFGEEIDPTVAEVEVGSLEKGVYAKYDPFADILRVDVRGIEIRIEREGEMFLLEVDRNQIPRFEHVNHSISNSFLDIDAFMRKVEIHRDYANVKANSIADVVKFLHQVELKYRPSH